MSTSPRLSPGFFAWGTVAASAFTLCWLVPLVVDAPDTLLRHGIFAAAWSLLALLWFLRWRRMILADSSHG